MTPPPSRSQANLGRRDASLPADRITVYIDPYHDKRSGYLFVVNAAGHRVDGLMYNDGVQDLTWDGVWEGRAHRDSLGWTAELRIPFSQMRFQSESEPVWGINFKRVILRRGEESLLAYTPRDGAGFVSRFPDLVGLKGIQPSRAIELSPYTTGKSEFLRHAENDPFNDGSRYSARTGLDLRAPVGRRLTLNATVNPDFGQVEVDPAVVNLTDVESTFEEKRPYFVEGASNFRFGREGSNSYWNFGWPEPRFFYSRRIGRAPQGFGERRLRLRGHPDRDDDPGRGQADREDHADHELRHAPGAHRPGRGGSPHRSERLGSRSGAAHLLPGDARPARVQEPPRRPRCADDGRGAPLPGGRAREPAQPGLADGRAGWLVLPRSQADVGAQRLDRRVERAGHRVAHRRDPAELPPLLPAARRRPRRGRSPTPPSSPATRAACGSTSRAAG